MAKAEILKFEEYKGETNYNSDKNKVGNIQKRGRKVGFVTMFHKHDKLVA
ncbi:hypothetical protein IJH72_00920 [Candidatus Saccharibacteria bacterium]|nr:hypothetical protein [Candidatus Saccharibacteria bacterium]MBR0372493.1 hypothetical protein [Candidatus Saccharibacteria bacterium]